MNPLKPNPLLVATSSLFCLPVLSLFLNDYSSFYNHFNEMIMIFTISLLSICRWANPIPLFQKMDSKMAKFIFFYFHIQMYQKRSKLKAILSFVFVGTLYKMSKLSRKPPNNVSHWYVYHFLFHIASICSSVKLYYQISFCDMFPKKIYIHDTTWNI